MTAESTVEDPWTPLKHLAATVEAAVLRNQPGILNDFEAALKKHKPTLIGLLKNSPRNSADAALVRKAATEGISLPLLSSNSSESVSEPSKQKLPASIVEEAMIVSEMFEMNEISSLQLLLQAEEQLCQYPGLTRGLVAVLLYYDGRKALVQALRTLIQGRAGVSWTIGSSEDITDLVTKYTQSLLEDGLVDKILSFLKSNDWPAEVMLLQKNLALGDARHRREVYDLFNDIRQGLADCIFAFAAQSGLPKQDTLRLIDYLSKVKPSDVTASGVLDDVNLTLTMALLYSIDAGAITKCSDGEESLQGLPILGDTSFIPTIHRRLAKTEPWGHTGLQSLAQFAWSMTIATLRSLASSLKEDQQVVVEEDELVLETALENGTFHWLLECILPSKLLKTEEFYVRRLHQLLTDLIIQMPLKVKDLRNRADEAARNKLMHEQEGVQFSVPLVGQHFENLLGALASLYTNDQYGLILDYWCPSENTERLPQRQVSLNKFVRLAGDLLMPSLYTPYVNLLNSLSSHPEAALHCFNLLKVNVGQTVSWDHFFASLHQYFANLRQDSVQQPMMDSIYRRPMTRGISPTEVQGLGSVLKLITNVTKFSEAARIAISEHSGWQPGLVMVGLLSCAVPTGLKAEILNALSSLALSAEVAASIWQNIEAAQVINTIPTTSQQRPLGLFSEIEEVEARNEEYPLTRAFLRLIDGLTDHGLPDGLGQGLRVPGFRPYYNFIRDHIFLKFSTRAYKNVSERWDIGRLVLKIMVKLLKDYEPSVGEFGGMTSIGFQIMTSLLQSSETLRLLLFLLDESVGLLDTYQDFLGKAEMESCSLCTLQLLEIGLQLQGPMMESSRAASNSSLILTSLSNLLLAINPRSGKPDHMLNVAKFVIHAWRLPTHSLHAIGVIRGVSRSSASAQTSLLATFRVNETVANMIIKGFADILDEGTGPAVTTEAIKLATIELLLDGLNLPGPTLTHFLLGFNLQKGISKSTIQPQGVLGAVRSPFHAILTYLRPMPSGEQNPSLNESPNLVVASMKLIFHLCSNMATSEVTLRFLRSAEDFLCSQISLLPYKGKNEQTNLAMAWLLKTVAIEVKMLSQMRQRSQVVRLSSLLLNSSESSGQTINSSTFLSQLSRAQVPFSGGMRPLEDQGGQQHRLLNILEAIDFSEETMFQPQFEVFDAGQIDHVLKQCKVNGRVDIRGLHKILSIELANLQSSTSNGLGSQRGLIQEEIRQILAYAVEWNNLQERTASKRNLLDAWRQVAEMLLCGLPSDQILLATSKQRLLLELIQMLLNKVLADKALLEMTNQVSGIVLLLMTSLRQTYDGKNEEQNKESFVSMLDSSSVKETSKLYSAALQAILKGLVMWIVGTSAAAQRVRANLYGALLNYLRIGKDKKERNADKERLRKANLEVLQCYGDGFLDIVCRDSVSGHEIRMMLALSLLDELIHLEGRGSWLYYLSKQGYLRHIIESLFTEDNQLANLVSSKPSDHLKAFYTYETKMALLTRLASTATGSEILLESSLMIKLAEMSVFSMRPEASFEGHHDEAVSAMYQQVVFPALKLCEAILASLGSENRSAASQVLHFITAHECLVRVGLHYSNLFTLSGLQELSLLTGVIARSITYETASEVEPEIASNLSRIQRQMLALTAHFGQNECLIKKMASGNLFAEDSKAKALNLVMEINANCAAYAASMTGKGKMCRVLASPSLDDSDSGNHRSLTLGHLTLMMQHTMAFLLATRANLRELKEKLATVGHLSTNELSSFLASNVSKSSRLDQRSQAADQMRMRIDDKEHQLALSVDSVENVAFVIWRHLDHFFHSSSSRQRIELDPIVKMRKSDLVLSSEESVEKLKKDTRTVYNEILFRKLDSVEATFEEDQRGIFFASINRRLKRIATLYS